MFGIAITHLTSLLARRSLYCSKHANGQAFHRQASQMMRKHLVRAHRAHLGERQVRVLWGSQKPLDRGEGLETHAYAFIHTDNIKARVAELFGGDMQFDVIIGNPPYQLNTDGFGMQARPIYQQFVQQAKTLDPRFLCMVIPARWFAGGMGLDEFRESMLTDDRVRSIDDYLTASDVFPGVGLKGASATSSGIVIIPGLVASLRITRTSHPRPPTRPLLEKGADVFIRFNEGLSILRRSSLSKLVARVFRAS